MATWTTAVLQMASFYVANVHTYQGTLQKPRIGRKAYSCSLVGGNVYDDCSGFTSACLLLFGAFPRTYVPTSGFFANLNGEAAKRLRAAGFSPYSYNINSLLPFDIIAKNGHVEIYAGKISSSMKSYSWGNIHDNNKGGLPCYMSKDSYTIIWRNSGVNIDTPINMTFSMQELMNMGYQSSNNNYNNYYGNESSAYPIHTEYDTYSGTGGNIFLNSEDNSISFAALLNNTSINVNDNIHTRIYSTNDASIVLDELYIPLDNIDISTNDTSV